MRPFRPEDEGLLFGVAKLAFADCDDGRTIATLERDTVFVAELAGSRPATSRSRNPLETLCIEQLCVHPAHEEEGVDFQLLDWAEGYAISRGSRRGSKSWSKAGTTAPSRSTAAAGSSRRAGSPRARPAAGSVASPSSSPALALPGGGVRARDGSSSRSRRTAPCSRPRRRRSRSSSTTRSARPGRARSSTRAAARCSPGRPAPDLALARPAASPGLPRGAYSVRWRVVSNDGHLVSGVLAFAVGAGLGPAGVDPRRGERDVQRVDPPAPALPRRRARRRRRGADRRAARRLALGRPGRARARRRRRLRPARATSPPPTRRDSAA